MSKYLRLLAVSISVLVLSFCVGSSESLPVRGLHLSAPSPEDVPALVKFIREALPREGVNVLVLEINYRYEFTGHPELRDSRPLTRAQVKDIVSACRDSGISLIPLLNCLGHQSWAAKTNPLLTSHPEFDETPGLYPNNEGIYCRSYCPRHPGLRPVLYSAIDELAEVFETNALHVGMDEVFLIGEDVCPRCKGVSRADLFGEEVTRLRDHLAEKKLVMWMWGDRFIDGKATGIGEWEASFNGTAAAIRHVPRDIVICDWHYENAPPTAGYFALHGLDVLASPWRKADVALAQLDLVRLGRTRSNDTLGPRFKGVLQTSWCDGASFIRAYYADPTQTAANEREKGAMENADCFKRLFAALRQ